MCRDEPSFDEREQLRTDLEDFEFARYGCWILLRDAQPARNSPDESDTPQLEVETPKDSKRGSSTDTQLVFQEYGTDSNALVNSPEMASNSGEIAIQRCVYLFVICDERGPLKVVYVGKADIFLERMRSHRRKRAPTSRLLRHALEKNLSIDVYYRDNQIDFTKHVAHFTQIDIKPKKNSKRAKEAFNLPSYHLEEIAFIRYFKPDWNYFQFR